MDGIESFYKDKISMLKERIETEKFERKIASTAQVQVSARDKKRKSKKSRAWIQIGRTRFKFEWEDLTLFDAV